MIAARTAGLTLCLALLPVSAAPQVPRGQTGDRLSRAQVRLAHVEQMNDEIQGLWKMERLRTGPEIYQGAQLHGYMLVAPEHLSLEFHIERFSKDGGPEGGELLFQTGFHHWRFTSLAELEMVGVIGTDGTSGSWPDFEPPGKKRVFRVQLGMDRMTLERGNLKMDLQRISRPAHTLPDPEVEAAREGAEEDGG